MLINQKDSHSFETRRHEWTESLIFTLIGERIHTRPAKVCIVSSEIFGADLWWQTRDWSQHSYWQWDAQSVAGKKNLAHPFACKLHKRGQALHKSLWKRETRFCPVIGSSYNLHGSIELNYRYTDYKCKLELCCRAMTPVKAKYGDESTFFDLNVSTSQSHLFHSWPLPFLPQIAYSFAIRLGKSCERTKARDTPIRGLWDHAWENWMMGGASSLLWRGDGVTPGLSTCTACEMHVNLKFACHGPLWTCRNRMQLLLKCVVPNIWSLASMPCLSWEHKKTSLVLWFGTLIRGIWLWCRSGSGEHCRIMGPVWPTRWEEIPRNSERVLWACRCTCDQEGKHICHHYRM